uniref:uncharacterized protein LOC122581198 n=1 Tax=Erigeron canadensis TaxID=72917 RepID=UPI001CB9BA28|nr:uncharacterized protein LOC122581198 [Erigeron canadensis]
MSSSSSNVDTSLMSLNEYLQSIWIPLNQIKSATNNFADENLLTQTSSELYKGQLFIQSSGEFVSIIVRASLSYDIAIQELKMLKNLRHNNIVPIFKYSVTDYKATHRLIIYKREVNESLDKHLSSSSMLSWMRRLHICVGIARALTYLHFDADEDQSVIHGNIKSSKILLDHHWEPKLHGFQFAVIAKRNQVYLIDTYKGSLLYLDPAYETTRGLTNKSDVFSFGVVLFEVLFGITASSVVPSTPDHDDNWYFARMARACYEEKKLDEKIDPNLRKQMNTESLNIFSETAYFCLKEQRSQRPDMKKVLQRLERALELHRIHESPEHSRAGKGTSSNHLKVKTLDHLKIQLSDIKLATNNFSDIYCIGSGGFATVYKAQLDHFDGNSSPTVNKGEKKVELPRRRGTIAIKRLFNRVDKKVELPKRRSTVAIKRIFGRVDGLAEKGFLAEIELLSKCKHPNIVSLTGYCDEEPEMILIYEYASNGSLEDYLGKSDKITKFTWVQRIKICIDIAYGLEYLHKVTEDKECIIHRDIKSANILLDDRWQAKIADFGLSKLHPTYIQRSTLLSANIGGTQVYLDPEYEKTGNLKTSSDIYSFGVVLCEIMSGNLAYDNIYNTMGLPSIVRQCFNDKTIEELVDPQLKEADENIYGLNEGLNHDSLYTFAKVASQCVAKAQVDRPTIEVIIKELEKSLNLQNNRKDNLLEAIKLGTQNFSVCNCTGIGRSWKLYKGEVLLANANGRTPTVAKRFDSGSDEGNSQFMTELKFLFEHKHKNIVGFVGYCNEMGEKVIVYEHASNGTLEKHLDNADLTWMKRLKIGLDVARGLEYLHTGGITKGKSMIHGDIKSSSILLDGDWRAKLSNFEELSYGSLSYKKLGFYDARLDMYSLGVVLLEMLVGRSACEEEIEEFKKFSLAKKWYKKDALDEMMFEGIKEQTVTRSLDAYSDITYKCLQQDNGYKTYWPGASEVVEKLTLALTEQEDHEIRETKLPKDYEKLSHMSGEGIIIPGRFKDFYDMLCDGFFFQEGKAWFSLGSNGKRNVMISAQKLSYTNRWQRKWLSIPESRFHVVAKMLDTMNMKVRIKIKPQLLLPGDNYGVHLVFKFKSGKCLAKQMFVNLTYKSGSDTLHSHFATLREDGWMTIELCQILNYKEDTEFKVVLESFSRSYCGRSSIYIEGVEFRTIEKEHEEDGSKEIKKYQETQIHEEIKKPEEIQHFPTDSKDRLTSTGLAIEGFLLKQVHYKKICFMLLDMEAPHQSSIAKPFHLKYSAESRFQGENELSKRQVFGIKGKIESQLLSPDKDYTCYLVFKLSETCHGLHCPVRVRDVLQWKNKETRLICFRPDTNGAKEREDGWMEVLVWKFNSNSQLRSNHIPMYLKFITYEGTMSGLIVSGLEIRPM